MTACYKSFRPPFLKGGEVKGEEPLSRVATREIFNRYKAPEKGEFFVQSTKKREKPQVGFFPYISQKGASVCSF
jgi:hypothetical protein